MEVSNDGSQMNDEVVSLNPVEFSNYDCEINDGFNKCLKDAGFDRFGFNYNVVTILGSQSSGKSHLLNSLFASKFETMDARKGHSQTTKGIWASLLVPKNTKTNATVVFDSEGTDSRERGEGRMTFEHRSSLFCLALSDMVVVNLWYNSLGNLTGSNYGLLKTVVEANLELVDTNNDQSYKTVLFFCVRDWSPDLSPLEVVKDYVMNKYMNSIWNEISKPQRFANVGVESLFEIRVFGLSNAVTDKEKFKQNVEEVRNTWSQLKPTKYSRLVPSDGFFVYSNNVWKTIINQNHLDIPSQKEMLSSYRCSEIKNLMLEKYCNKFKELKENEFNDFVTKLLMESEEEYFTQASRYDNLVSERVGKDLLTQLCVKLQPYYETSLGEFVKKLAVESSSLLEKEFSLRSHGKELKISDNKPYELWPNFSKKCQQLQQSQLDKLQIHLEKFNVLHKGGKITFNYQFDNQQLRENLKLSVSNEFDLLRSRHLELLKQQVELLSDSCFVVVKNNLMDRNLNVDEFWKYFDELFEETYKNCIDLYKTSYLGLVNEVNKGEFEHLSLLILLKSSRRNFEKLENELEELVLERFDKFFNYQEFKGELVPTEWHKQSEQDLNNKYKQSKEDSLNLLQIFKKTKLRKVEEFNLELIKKNHYFYRTFVEEIKENYSNLLNDEKELEIKQLCSKKFLELYKNAQVVQSAGTSLNSWRNIPAPFWLILLVLGWNEIRAAFKVLLRFQLLIPLLLFLYFGFTYAANTFLGPTAQQYAKLVRSKALKLLTTCVSWFVKTVHTINSSRSSTPRSSRERRPKA